MGNHFAPLRLFAFVVALFVFMANADAARVPITKSPFPLPGAKGEWQIVFDVMLMKLEFDKDDTTNGTVGTLWDVTVRKDVNAHQITFEQTKPLDDDSPLAGGLRVNFSTNVKNETTQKWSTYSLVLIELTPIPNDSKDHPTWAHFHPIKVPTDGKKATFNPFVKYTPPMEPPAPEKLDVMDSQNFVDINGFMEVRNLLIHEREFAKETVAKRATGCLYSTKSRFRVLDTRPRPGCSTPKWNQKGEKLRIGSQTGSQEREPSPLLTSHF